MRADSRGNLGHKSISALTFTTTVFSMRDEHLISSVTDSISYPKLNNNALLDILDQTVLLKCRWLHQNTWILPEECLSFLKCGFHVMIQGVLGSENLEESKFRWIILGLGDWRVDISQRV
jgi:hypothetical protein